jgi:hypothetical protein
MVVRMETHSKKKLMQNTFFEIAKLKQAASSSHGTQ